MPETDLPDQTIVNLEAYLMGTNPPPDIAIAFAKLAREVRRRRFESIGDDWRKKFVQYGKHLPVCFLMMNDDEGSFSKSPSCNCGFYELMKRANII